MTELDPSEVRRRFDYLPDGRLVWAIRVAHRTPAGTLAGYFHAGTGAHVVTIGGSKHQRSRLVFAWHHGRWPNGRLWHSNGDSSDDRIENLVDRAEPDFPERLERRMGTTRRPKSKGWQATYCGRHLGTFPTPQAAHAAYAEAHREATAPGGAEMSNACPVTAAPGESHFFANGKNAEKNTAEGSPNGPL